MIANTLQPQSHLSSMLLFNINISNVTAKKILQLNDGQSTINTTLRAGSSQSFGISGKAMQMLSIEKIQGESLDYVLKLDTEIISQGKTGQNLCIPSDGNNIYQLILSNNTQSTQKQVLSIKLLES